MDVSTERRVDVALKLGQVSDTVEVSGEAMATVDTTTDELGGTLTAQTIANIPVNGRDYTKLIYLNPGVAGSPDQISDSPGSFGTFSMNGSRGRSNNFLLDGTDMNDGFRNDPAINEAGVFGDPATILPIDAVAELRVLSNYEAEYGRNSGAVVNIVTKSGTNQWHGSALEYYRSGAMGARNYFNIDSQPKNPFTNNQFGGSLGGPIVKDKAFFFVNYEGQRESGAQAGLSCVPDAAAIAAAEAQAAANGIPLSQTMLNLLARNPWPSPNISGASPTRRHLQCPNASAARRQPRDLHPFLQQRGQPDREGRLQPNTDNNIHRPLLLRQQQSEFSFRAVGRRPVAGIQHRHADHGATGIAVVGEGGELGAGERGPSRLEPVRRRLLPRRPELQSCVHRPGHRRDFSVQLRPAEDLGRGVFR